MRTVNKDLIGASTALLVLGVLAHEPSYGYQIVRSLNDAADGIFVWGEGTVYPLLHKLEKEQLLRSQWQDAKSGHPRKYYQITARGRAKLTAQTRQWNAFHGLLTRITRVRPA